MLLELATAHGFHDDFVGLMSICRGPGMRGPSDLSTLPLSMKAMLLTQGSGGAHSEPIDGLKQLIDRAPEAEQILVRMLLNVDQSYSDRDPDSRIAQFAKEHDEDPGEIGWKSELALLKLLMRTQPAAEKEPEPRSSIRDAAIGPVGRFFDENYVSNSDRFTAAWESARTVDMIGFGHNRMTVTYSASIRDLLAREGIVRVLLQDPEESAVLQANQRSSTPKASEESVRYQHRAGVVTLLSIAAQVGQPGGLQIRTVNLMPPFTGYFFDAESDNGIAFIWFWSWRQASAWRPGFSITKETDPMWFGRFHSQFESMWTDHMDCELPVD